MKILALVLLMFTSIFTVDLSVIREQFRQAKTSQSATDKLYEALSDYTKNDPVILAYKGASQVLSARFLKDRNEKKELVSRGINNIETAVKEAPQKVEIRVVRLAIQENSPKILKYKGNMEDDKIIILTNFDNQTPLVRKMIKDYVAQSDYFTQAEKTKVKE